jgi:hypothetical protein
MESCLLMRDSQMASPSIIAWRFPIESISQRASPSIIAWRFPIEFIRKLVIVTIELFVSQGLYEATQGSAASR